MPVVDEQAADVRRRGGRGWLALLAVPPLLLLSLLILPWFRPVDVQLGPTHLVIFGTDDGESDFKHMISRIEDLPLTGPTPQIMPGPPPHTYSISGTIHLRALSWAGRDYGFAWFKGRCL